MDRRSFVTGGLGLLASAAVPASVRAAGDPALALLSGSRWRGTVITYGFPGPGFAWEYRTGFTGGFLPASETEKALYRKALGEWAAASGGAVSFVETRPRKAQLRLAVTTASVGTLPDGNPRRGWTYYPGTAASAGDAWLQAGVRALGYADGQKGGFIMRHEIGHALGLKHPHEGSPRLPVALDYAAHTIMTYRTYQGDSTPGGWPDGLPSYPHVLGDLDGRAIRLIYTGSSATVRRPGLPDRDAPLGQE
jgi:serralysin